MKFIKSKKIFESSISIETEVEDILKDIQDCGHDLHLKVHNFKDYDRLDVFISFLDKSSMQTITDIGIWFDLFRHLFSHLESEGWILHSTYIISDEKIGQSTIAKIDTNLDLNETTKMCKRLEIRFDKFK